MNVIRFLRGLKLSILLSALLMAQLGVSADKLIIISPHRKSIQQEFIPKFKDHYKATYKTDVQVDWIDQGGTSDDVRFVRAKYAKNSDTCGIDIFWGGGTTTFLELARDGILAKYDLPKILRGQIPKLAAGVPLYDDTETWYASAMSSFGIFYNRKIVKFDKLVEPKTWEDLAKPAYMNQLTLADPRRSGSASAMNDIVLQSLGWEKGFGLLTLISANNRKFTHSSSDPIKAVVSGDTAAAMAIDFYANAKIADLGKDNLGFVLPAGQTVLDPDPVAVLKGAPNQKVAERFVAYILSSEAQKLLILPKGTKEGPMMSSLGRMAINQVAYDETEGLRVSDFNPFKQKAFLTLDLEKASKMRRTFNDLVGATLIDTHKDLKQAWGSVLKRGEKKAEIAELSTPLVTEAELLKLSEKWDDEVFRNKTINSWIEKATTKYKKLASR
jgi:ABC-type Fe3+ transport system substrate-binding protein